jgi:hypothetical protein
VYRLPLAEFAYNNSDHASIGVMLFFAKKDFHPSIEAIIWAILAHGSVPDVPDTKAQVEKFVELH